ncbi:MAG: hypothetical protein ACETVR_04415 [Candidatus Bathyarchaeia archaeon]
MGLDEGYIKHDGELFKIYYYPIDSFEDDLPLFGKFLEALEERGEGVSAIIPNTGWVTASWFLEGFQGVKGFAVIARKAKT